MAKKKVSTAEETVRNIRRQTRKKYSGEEKIRIVLEGLRGEMSVAELCRREGIQHASDVLARLVKADSSTVGPFVCK